MIELGIVQLVLASPAVSAIAPVGGFNSQLPENQSLPSWSYAITSNPGDYTLQGQVGNKQVRMRVNCHGNIADEAIRLAAAIDAVLSGARGVLTDPDNTKLQGCFRINVIDFFDDARRSYRRVLEYQLGY